MGYLLCVKFSVVGFKERRKEERGGRKEGGSKGKFVCVFRSFINFIKEFYLNIYY